MIKIILLVCILATCWSSELSTDKPEERPVSTPEIENMDSILSQARLQTSTNTGGAIRNNAESKAACKAQDFSDIQDM